MVAQHVKRSYFLWEPISVGLPVSTALMKPLKDIIAGDVLPTCRSVISFACRFPAGVLHSPSPVVYTRIRNSITDKIDRIALDICIEMEKHHIHCVPVPANESEFDERTGRYRSIVSQKHAAQAAGLGTIGRHSLLLTPEFGSMIWLGMVLCEQELEPDERKPSMCTNCDICVKACPVHALDGPELNKWPVGIMHLEMIPNGHIWRIACHACRDSCPYNLGKENAW